MVCQNLVWDMEPRSLSRPTPPRAHWSSRFNLWRVIRRYRAGDPATERGGGGGDSCPCAPHPHPPKADSSAWWEEPGVPVSPHCRLWTLHFLIYFLLSIGWGHGFGCLCLMGVCSGWGRGGGGITLPGTHLSVNVEWSFTRAFYCSAQKFPITKDSCCQNAAPSLTHWNILITRRIKQFIFYRLHIAPGAMDHEGNLLFQPSSAARRRPHFSTSCGCHICSVKSLLMYQLFWSASAGVWTNKLDCAPPFHK